MYVQYNSFNKTRSASGVYIRLWIQTIVIQCNWYGSITESSHELRYVSAAAHKSFSSTNNLNIWRQLWQWVEVFADWSK